MFFAVAPHLCSRALILIHTCTYIVLRASFPRAQDSGGGPDLCVALAPRLDSLYLVQMDNRLPVDTFQVGGGRGGGREGGQDRTGGGAGRPGQEGWGADREGKRGVGS